VAFLQLVYYQASIVTALLMKTYYLEVRLAVRKEELHAVQSDQHVSVQSCKSFPSSALMQW